MLGKVILHDFVAVCLLVMGCLGLGLVVNETRNPLLPLVYLNPEARLNAVVEGMSAAKTSNLPLDADVNLDDMRRMSADHSVLVLDARPEALFESGHIPTALSLPSDDFKRRFRILQKALDAYRDKTIVVYCSGPDCPDSRLTAEALRKLGWRHVRLFRGGWSEWTGASLPKEKGCGC